MLAKAVHCNPTFYSLSEVNQFVFLFPSPDLVRIFAKTWAKIMQRRHTLTCKKSHDSIFNTSSLLLYIVT